MEEPQMKILFIGEREEDYDLINYLLSCSTGLEYVLEWESSYRAALDSRELSEFDILLVDCRPGNEGAIQLVRETSQKGLTVPLVILSENEISRDESAYLEASADDLLPKSQLNTLLLERTILYAIEHRSNKQALQQMEAWLGALQHFVSSAVFTTDNNCRITSWNESAERLTGYSSSEVLGEECSLFIESPERKRRPNKRDKNETDSPSECVIRTKDGQKIPAIRISFQLSNDTGKPFGVITSLAECSGLENIESDPLNTDHLKELRQSAKEICHELKQSLKAVLGYTQMVLNYGEYDWRQKKYLERIIQHVDRMNHIAFQLHNNIENGVVKRRSRLKVLHPGSMQ